MGAAFLRKELPSGAHTTRGTASRALTIAFISAVGAIGPVFSSTKKHGGKSGLVLTF
jgi:hypothetical protein